MSRSNPDMVAIPRRLLYMLGGGLGLSLLGLAFLLGRQTAPEPVVVVPPAAADDGPVVVEEELPAAHRRIPPIQAEPEPMPAEEVAATTVRSTGPVTTGPRQGTDERSLAVASYFQQMEMALARGKTWTDPNAMATMIIEDAMKGRTDGFDQLIRSNQQVLDEVRALDVPGGCSGCARHHGDTLTILKDSVALLTELRNATAAGNLDVLVASQERAVGLERRARDVETLGLRVQKEHGLR